MEMSSDPTQCRSIKEGEVEPQPDREQGEPEISPDSLPGERESPEEEEETK
jgi:hypothetical protein